MVRTAAAAVTTRSQGWTTAPATSPAESLHTYVPNSTSSPAGHAGAAYRHICQACAHGESAQRPSRAHRRRMWRALRYLWGEVPVSAGIITGGSPRVHAVCTAWPLLALSLMKGARRPRASADRVALGQSSYCLAQDHRVRAEMTALPHHPVRTCEHTIRSVYASCLPSKTGASSPNRIGRLRRYQCATGGS